MSGASVFERTWEAAIELCRHGEAKGHVHTAGTVPLPDGSGRQWAVLGQAGEVVYLPGAREEEEAMCLFAAARRFAELEQAHELGQPPPPPTEEPRRTFEDSLREWGLMDEKGRVLSAYESDPEPLLGYVVRVGNVYAYGVVKQSILSAGTITPTGACESAEEARRRASELLMLALVRGATVMGMNGVPAVIDLSAEPEES